MDRASLLRFLDTWVESLSSLIGCPGEGESADTSSFLKSYEILIRKTPGAAPFPQAATDALYSLETTEKGHSEKLYATLYGHKPL